VQGSAPLRGTQSFVGVMAEVFKRPGLTAIELLWRCVAWAPVFLLVAVGLGSLGINIEFHPELLSSVTVFKPIEAVAALQAFFSVLKPLENPHLLGWLAALAVVWIAASTFGRALILRRLEPTLHQQLSTFLLLGALRTASVIAIAFVWLSGCAWVIEAIVLRPVARHQDPNLVLGFALLVTGTLVLFILWCTVSWLLQLAPLLVMARHASAGASLRQALQNVTLRGKLIEINLVMGIVKVCLIVLAMVFSACPLPFESVETRTFLVCWTFGVGLLYLIASDYFHVVRAAAYLRLWQACEILPQTASPAEKPAS
jgi:hypothetical protein